MGQLCLYLPPFASDYSGACSVLYDLRALIAINDASCCTAHYIYYDEPRWEREQRPVFCTSLRNVEAILGADKRVIEQVCAAQRDVQAPLIALVDTPVPALVGTDAPGMAQEVESRCNTPAFGFDTTGFSWYDKGIVMAGRALFDRFAQPVDAEDRKPNRVNIIGMTPLDFGDAGNDTDLVALLARNGIEVGCTAFMGATLESLAQAGTAALNLAVSAAGVELARHLRRTLGIPWLAGFPVGGTQTEAWMARVNAQLEALASSTAGKDTPRQAAAAQNTIDEVACPQIDESETSRTLIVTDQVIGNAVRERMMLEGETSPADVCTFFGFDRGAAQEHDNKLADEASFLRLLRTKAYTRIVADPLICEVAERYGTAGIPLAHPAVSSRLHWADVPHFLQG